MNTETEAVRYEIARLSSLPAIECPCGSARRAFLEHADKTVSIHEVTISADAKAHYHREHTELYYILSGNGQIELDGTIHNVATGDAVLIKPGCRHRAIGEMKILNVVVPAFDPTDEWFD